MVKMNVLVTGSCGQLGRSIMDAAPASRENFVYSDVMPDAELGVVGLDITDSKAVLDILSDKKIDVVINCAGYTDVERAESEEDLAFRINSDAVRVLAEAARGVGAVVIHISTDYVFDGSVSEPYAEGAEPAPLSAYGRSKLAGELALRSSGVPFFLIRTSWLYSRYGKNFVKTMLEKTSSEPVVRVVSDQIGTPTFAGDLAEFIVSLLEPENIVKTGIYHYTNEGVCSWYDLAYEVCRVSGNLCDVLPCRTSEYPVKAVRPHYSVLDKSKVKKVFSVGIPHWTDSLAFCLSQLG